MCENDALKKMKYFAEETHKKQLTKKKRLI